MVKYKPLLTYVVLIKNALTIHYTKNVGDIAADEMVLVDAGGVRIRIWEHQADFCLALLWLCN